MNIGDTIGRTSKSQNNYRFGYLSGLRAMTLPTFGVRVLKPAHVVVLP